MYAYIKGHIVEHTPAYVVVENNGIGYHINISVNTASVIQGKKEVQLYLYHYLKESAYPVLFGFINLDEKQLFLDLISVSGIGTNTARMILSAYSSIEIKEAIASGNVNFLKSIKGIGIKSAQRIIVELQDKFKKNALQGETIAVTHNSNVNEALSALLILGFPKVAASKAIDKILKADPSVDSVEGLVKQCLKIL